MKSLLLTVLVLFSFHFTSVLADACRTIEYAELKDTPSTELAKTFCRYKAYSDIEIEHLDKLRSLYLESPAGVAQKSAKKLIDDHSKDLYECLDMRSKIRSALRNRSEPDGTSRERGLSPHRLRPVKGTQTPR